MSEKTDKELVKRIAVDIDGTLTEQAAFPDIYKITNEQLMEEYEKAKPRKEMVKWVNKMYDRGFTIVLNTARSDLFQAQLKRWLKKYKIKYTYYRMGKVYADIYVDDKSIRPEEVELWEKLLA